MSLSACLMLCAYVLVLTNTSQSYVSANILALTNNHVVLRVICAPLAHNTVFDPTLDTTPNLPLCTMTLINGEC